jgi:peroxiredoxin
MPVNSRQLLRALPLAALLILLLVAFKITRPPVNRPVAEASVLRQAPLFELFDQQMQRVPLARYLGRHKLLVLFFDARHARGGSPVLEELKRHAAALERTGAIVLAISTAPPAVHREAFPKKPGSSFALLSDILEGREGAVHQLWGAFDASTGQTREAVFVVDRAGVIRYEHLSQEDLGNAAVWIQELNTAP